ncbi:MAG: hypothetical protein NVSMB4_07270 [Acidimicrobiales bacterium]
MVSGPDGDVIIVEPEVDLVARLDAQLISKFLGDDDLTFWADAMSHTDKYNLAVHPRWPRLICVTLLLSYCGTTVREMAVRKKRSISMPPDLDARIEAAASQAGMTYSGWLAATASKEFIIQAGLNAVADFEREQGSFTAEELAEAEQWARSAIERGQRSGARHRRTA